MQHAALYKRTYKDAGIDPSLLCCVECHGAGTTAGDPEEANGLYLFEAKNRTKNNPLLLASVKTNMGHGEAASGIKACILACEFG